MISVQTSQQLLKIQSDLLERLATGADIDASLDDLCTGIESLVPNSVCTIMYFEPKQGRLVVGAAPNAPQSLCAKLDGLLPAAAAASCGTAAFRGETVIVEDTLVDPLWADYREIAEEYGIRGCWSIPIFCDRQLVGTFAISISEPRKPGPHQMRILETGCHLAGIAISRRRSEEQRQQMERKIQQAHKMESLGVLAGGIAHDFNNLLTGAMGNIDLAQALISDPSQTSSYLESVDSALLRMADLSKQMLAYSGGTRFEMQPVYLGDLITDMVDLLKAAVSKDASIRIDVPASRPQVLGDPARLRQVVMNLITNASDSIGKTTGTITLRLRTAQIAREDLADAIFGEIATPGPCVWIEVEDTGIGMDAETCNRMFDPFFTTKPEGHGLGLASTLGIVRSHSGAIEIETSPGNGTRVRIYFPACQVEDSVARPKTTDAFELKGKSAVLVVDDEDYIRQFASTVLTEAGFRVVVASDGEEAIRVFESCDEKIDAVLLDFSMPGIDGAEVFRRMTAIRPVPVVLCSGYSETQATQRLTELELAGYLQKPYRSQELSQLFLRILHEQSEAVL